jgi:two-component system sensor histidine kinase DesK
MTATTSVGPADAGPTPAGTPASTIFPRDERTAVRVRRLWSLAWLFFMAIPIANLISTHAEPPRLGVGLAAVTLFTVVYLWMFGAGWLTPERGGYRGLQGPVGIATISVLASVAAFLTVIDGPTGWATLFFFAGVTAATLYPTAWAYRAIAGVTLACIASLVAAGHEPVDAVVTGLDVGLIALMTLSFTTLRQANRDLQAARDDLARLAVAEERSRIARDLHDTLGHSLSLITLKSELAGRLLPDDPGRARAEIADVERVARESLSAIRETVGGYRRPTLAAELAAARIALRAADLDVRIEAPEEPLPGPADEALAWAVREGVTNIMRHSHATRVTIRVLAAADRATVEVTDDGTPAADPGHMGRDGRPTAPGHGLAGLRERLSGAGGELEAGPLDGGGYRLRADVPLSMAGAS